MAQTAQATVKRALRLIGAIEAGEDPAADMMQDGVRVLNNMLFAWANEGVDLVHSTVAQGDNLLVEDSFLEGIEFNLAVRLAPEYGMSVPQWVSKRAVDTFSSFQAKTHEYDDDLTVDTALQPKHFTRRIGSYNIENG